MADQNLIDSEALARVQDIEFVHQFEQGVTALLAVLDIAEPRVMAAGTQIQMYEITGVLQSGAVAEGHSHGYAFFLEGSGGNLREMRAYSMPQMPITPPRMTQPGAPPRVCSAPSMGARTFLMAVSSTRRIVEDLL